MRLAHISLALTYLLAATGADAAAIDTETQAFHDKRIATLTREDGWLSVVGLAWLNDGANVAGSAEGSAVRFPQGAPERIGVFMRGPSGVSFEASPGVRVTASGPLAITGSIPLAIGPEEESEVLTTGRFLFYVIRRGDRFGVRIKDPQSAARRNFHGIPMFPPSVAWRIEARFEPAPAGSMLAVQNVLGQSEPTPTPGTAVFRIAGKEYRLAPTQEGDSLFFVFADETNGKESYGSGRFLNTPLPKDGKVILDFNQAINPPCAFTAYATCPLPPKGNRLPLRVEAGEKAAGAHGP
jgi:uncharacterized protein (DUF1684 family)